MRQQINFFTAGLGEPLKTDVELQAPINLQTAMSLARAYEARNSASLIAVSESVKASSARTGGRTFSAAPKPSFARQPTPTASAAAPSAAAASSPALSAASAATPAMRPRFKRLTPEEMAAKRTSGECYFCSDKFVPSHKCGGKGVFLLEMEDGMEADHWAEDLGISLHAITGIDVADTMHLRVRIGDTTLLALVDSGSTHTFLRESVAESLGL